MPPASDLHAEQLLRDYVMSRLRRERRRLYDDDLRHLADCPDTVVDTVTGEDGRCGEGTCEMVFFEYTLSCPHRLASSEWEDFSQLADVLAAMERRADVATGVAPFYVGHRFMFGALGECRVTNVLKAEPPFLYKVQLPSGSHADVPHDAILKISGVDGVS